MLVPVLLLVPQAAAKPDTASVNPQLASVVATALQKAGPQPLPPRFPHLADQLAAEASYASQKRQEAAQALLVAPVVTYTTPAVTTPQIAVSQSEAWYKAWIYNEESGSDPTRANSSGCLGLGQACPGSKLLAVCPNLDYTCEDNFFTQYMLSRYGTWEAAYNFHISNGWW